MPSSVDEIYVLNERNFRSLPERSMREGFWGKTLEEALQTLLEKHPQVIPSTQISSDAPPIFVLLRREMPVGTWSLDHLFVDQYGVLTLVEAKLIQNPQSRREVIGQILEYAANAVKLWSDGAIREMAMRHYADKDEDLDEKLAEVFGESFDASRFWASVENNVSKGVLRLIIAGDQISPNVRRMIEYLGNEMENVEFYGLELTCYGEDDSDLILVPRLIGQSQRNMDKKASGPRTHWSISAVSAAIEEIHDDTLRNRLSAIYQWAVDHDAFDDSTALELTFGVKNSHGLRHASFMYDGSIYLGLNKEKHFGGDDLKRQQWFVTVRGIGLLEVDSVDDILDGRWASRKLQDLSDEEFGELLAAVEQQCEIGNK